MSNIIDRRLNPRDKAIKNRQRFIQRSKAQIKKAVKEQIDNGNIAEVQKGKVKVKVKGIKEPKFDFDRKTGDDEIVLPGNDEYSVGDTIEKPKSGDGGGGSQGGLGESEDDFEFVLNQDEYTDFIFQDLELPDLIKVKLKNVFKTKYTRTGFKKYGTPNQLDVIRSLRNSLARRISLSRPKLEEIEELQAQKLLAEQEEDWEKVEELETEIARLLKKRGRIPWVDPLDLRYRNYEPQPLPIAQAVMFCVMDVSGSMGQEEKDLAKRFFFLLYLFLTSKYEKVDIVFIKHHEQAFEVDEKEFFYGKESGGTVVSTALKLTKEIIDQRYNLNDWNVYVAQCSDGDNYQNDSQDVKAAMQELLPIVQYFAYVEIKGGQFQSYRSGRKSEIWSEYEDFTHGFPHLNLKEVYQTSDIWKVFKELFQKSDRK